MSGTKRSGWIKDELMKFPMITEKNQHDIGIIPKQSQLAMSTPQRQI